MAGDYDLCCVPESCTIYLFFIFLCMLQIRCKHHEHFECHLLHCLFWTIRRFLSITHQSICETGIGRQETGFVEVIYVFVALCVKFIVIYWIGFCEFVRLFQLVLIQIGMRALPGPLRVPRKARSCIYHARIRAKWER